MRVKLCSSCEIRGIPVDDSSRKVAGNAMGGSFSAKSSIRRPSSAQRKHFTIIVRGAFPHFHSDGYYYDLYTYIKTG